MSSVQVTANRENVVRVKNGWMMLGLVLAILLVDAGIVLTQGGSHPGLIALVVLSLVAIVFILAGFFTLQPNEARVLVLFGAYKGTVRESGFHWGNPFYSNGSQPGVSDLKNKLTATQGDSALTRSRSLGRNKISLRARTLNGDRLKVNDRRGNPIEIGAVVVWRVSDTAQSLFDVDDYENYVPTQSESAVRHLASQYSYDGGEENEITLRSNVEEVSLALKAELEERLVKAG